MYKLTWFSLNPTAISKFHFYKSMSMINQLKLENITSLLSNDIVILFILLTRLILTFSIRCDSTTTWTEFCHFWPPPLYVDNFYTLSMNKNRHLLTPSPLIGTEWPLTPLRKLKWYIGYFQRWLFSESVIRFFKSPNLRKTILQKNYPELEI